VNGTESSFTEVLWKWVIGLSEFLTSVSELTELVEWTFFIFNVMLAELSLVLLLQSVHLAGITVEAVIV
jgi:hypothetical protein